MAYDFKADLQSKVNKNPPPLKPTGPSEANGKKPNPPIREIGYQPKANKTRSR